MALCVRTEERTAHVRTGRGMREISAQVTEALGPCGEDGTCPDDARCDRHRRCVPGAPAEPESTDETTRGTEERARSERPAREHEANRGHEADPEQITGAEPAKRSPDEEVGAPPGDSTRASADAPATSGCGCRTGGRAPPGAPWLALLVALACTARRRLRA